MARRSSFRAVCGVALLVASTVAYATDPSRFAASVDLVALDVCVRDATGRFIPDLSASDFVLLENGKRQRLAFVVPSDGVPLTVVMLIDRSGSMEGAKLRHAIDTASAFAALLGPRDRLEILGFNDQAVRLHAFEDDPRRVPDAPAPLRAVGGTSLYDALLVAANAVTNARAGDLADTREAIIVLSDGEDMSSRIDFDEVLAAVRRSGVLVYTVSLRTDAAGQWAGATWPMLAMTGDTGGRALGVPRLAALADLCREINTELRHMYRLG